MWQPQNYNWTPFWGAGQPEAITYRLKNAIKKRENMAVTGIILAGGKNLRYGKIKALEKIGNIVLIQRVVNRLVPLIDQLVIVTGKEKHGLPNNLGAVFVKDVYPDRGPLGGIYTGLNVSKNDVNILVACDMPFLNTELLRHLVFLSSTNDAVVPCPAPGMFEPLHAVYSCTCIPVIKRHLDANEKAISSFFNEVKVLYVEEEECRQYDPHLCSFFNINTQEDFDKANKIAVNNL